MFLAFVHLFKNSLPPPPSLLMKRGVVSPNFGVKAYFKMFYCSLLGVKLIKDEYIYNC